MVRSVIQNASSKREKCFGFGAVGNTKRFRPKRNVFQLYRDPLFALYIGILCHMTLKHALALDIAFSRFVIGLSAALVIPRTRASHVDTTGPIGGSDRTYVSAGQQARSFADLINKKNNRTYVSAG